MAVKSVQVSVGTVATVISGTDPGDGNAAPDGQSIAIANPAGGVNVYLGGADVTTANGYLLLPGEKAGVDLAGREVLYACVGSGTQVVYVLRTGV